MKRVVDTVTTRAWGVTGQRAHRTPESSRDAIDVDCPKCGATPGVRCMDARYKCISEGVRFLIHRHNERVVAHYIWKKGES